MSRLGNVVQISIIVGVIFFLLMLLFPFLAGARLNSDRINCENHLKDVGLIGLRHASLPSQQLPPSPVQEIPPGTIINSNIPIDDRLSWYVMLLNVLDVGIPQDKPAKRHISPRGLNDTINQINLQQGWQAPGHETVVKYRLKVAICPALVATLTDDFPQPNHYIGCGGIGIDTPRQSVDVSGQHAGAFRFDWATRLDSITDGLRQTAQLIETSSDVGPWLAGGASTVRGLSPTEETPIGTARPFGGCHPGGCYVSFCDGSVSFIKSTINPAVFRSMWTITGGQHEQPFDAP